jgi:4-aminobutyrate aminotransferase
MGDFIFHQLSDWRERHKTVGDVRGKGLMIGIEFVRNQRTKEKAPEMRDRIIDLAFEKGLLLLGAGENSIRLAPPLIIDEEQAEFAVRTLDACIAAAERSI